DAYLVSRRRPHAATGNGSASRPSRSPSPLAGEGRGGGSVGLPEPPNPPRRPSGARGEGLKKDTHPGLRGGRGVEKAPHSEIAQGVAPSPARSAEQILFDQVSRRTGYPRAMLQLDFDMEGDLGIDSIKR